MAVTGKNVVDVIITEKAVFHVTEQGLLLIEKDPAISIEELRTCTDADFLLADTICSYRLGKNK